MLAAVTAVQTAISGRKRREEGDGFPRDGCAVRSALRDVAGVAADGDGMGGRPLRVRTNN
jgi:hypothetical protein